MTATAQHTKQVVHIDVRGLPRPQGSMKAHVLPGGKVAMRYPPGVHAWRAQVQQAVADTQMPRFEQAVEVRLGFDLPRPQTHYLPANGKRAVPEVNPKAPPHPTTIPDLDKLVRAVLDAITDAGLWRDDSQVVSLVTAKRYTDDRPGVLIQVQEVQ
jgi:Holliday junction resolvase RusA-like endonuclease